MELHIVYIDIEYTTGTFIVSKLSSIFWGFSFGYMKFYLKVLCFFDIIDDVFLSIFVYFVNLELSIDLCMEMFKISLERLERKIM